MGEDQIVPAMHGDQTVTGSQIDAGLPFCGADLIFDTVGRLDGGYAHGKEVLLLLFCSREPV
ncbi:hypothetical protein D3C78_1963270 [compost metagenome]